MSTAREILGIDRRKAILTGVGALVLVAGAVALLGQAADFGEMLDALEAADRRWFALCVGGQALTYVGYVLAYRDVARARRGPELSYWSVTRIVMVSFGAYIVGSAAGGLAVDYWAIHKTGVGVHQAARRVLALHTLQWAALGSFAAVAGAVLIVGIGDGAPSAMTLGWIVAVPLCVLAALWVSSPARADRLAELSRDEPRKRAKDPGAWAAWAAAKLRNGFADAVGGVVFVRAIVSRPHRYPGAVLGFPVYWLGDLVTLYGALRAFTGAGIALAALVLAYATGYAATALPLPAGGAGGIEAALSFALHVVGIALAPAVLAALVYRFFTFWLPIGPALAFLPTLGRLSEDLESVRRA